MFKQTLDLREDTFEFPIRERFAPISDGPLHLTIHPRVHVSTIRVHTFTIRYNTHLNTYRGPLT